MTSFRTVKVAAVQATPVILDADASVDKVIGLLEDAAGQGVDLAVFPETFLSIYPSNTWAEGATEFEGAFDELWQRMWESAIDVPGPHLDRLTEACRRLGIHLAIGANERESDRPGSLYNALVLVGPDGLLLHHRKLMPTHHERLFHGIGAGDDLGVADTAIGRVGGLICWENRMPLARWAVYQGGPQIWVAPTADDSDGWLASMRHIAIESGAWVVSVPQYIPRSAFPDDFPVELPERNQFGRGGAAIVEPEEGEIVAGPLYGEEGMVIADCDLRAGLKAKRFFDAVGHYSRREVFEVVSPPAGRIASPATEQGGNGDG
jgi:predicted amidohydrolase